MSTTPAIRFGGGLPDPGYAPPLADLFDAVLHEDPEAFTYDQTHLRGGGVWGHEPLRHAIANRLGGRSGASLDAGNVVLVNGAAGAIELVAANLVRPGTTVAVEELTYPAALKVFRRRGATVVSVPLDADGLRVDALSQMLSQGRRAPSVLYTIATGQSPTGTTLAAGRRQALARLAEQYHMTIVQDDTYGEVIFAQDPPTPLIGLAPDRTVHVGSFSKTLAPGLRLGWVAARTDVCEAIARERTDLGQTPIVQYVVGRFFDSGRFEPHLARITDAYRQKRDVLVEALDRYCPNLVTWTVPEAGFFVWATLIDGDVDEVARLGLEEGVSFVGGPYFRVDEPDHRGIRLAYSELTAAQIDEGCRRLATAIERAAASANETRRAPSSLT
jgi:2-aminoadipate transaminase